MIKMVSGECGGAVNHKLSLMAGCSVSSTSIANTILKVFRYNYNMGVSEVISSIS